MHVLMSAQSVSDLRSKKNKISVLKETFLAVSVIFLLMPWIINISNTVRVLLAAKDSKNNESMYEFRKQTKDEVLRCFLSG